MIDVVISRLYSQILKYNGFVQSNTISLSKEYGYEDSYNVVSGSRYGVGSTRLSITISPHTGTLTGYAETTMPVIEPIYTLGSLDPIDYVPVGRKVEGEKL